MSADSNGLWQTSLHTPVWFLFVKYNVLKWNTLNHITKWFIVIIIKMIFIPAFDFSFINIEQVSKIAFAFLPTLGFFYMTLVSAFSCKSN